MGVRSCHATGLPWRRRCEGEHRAPVASGGTGLRDATPQDPARRSGLLRLRASEPGALLRCHGAQGGAPAGAWVPHRGSGRRGVSGKGGVLLHCNRNEPEGAAPRRRAGVLLQCNRNEPEGVAPSEDFGVACAALGPAGGRATRSQTGTTTTWGRHRPLGPSSSLAMVRRRRPWRPCTATTKSKRPRITAREVGGREGGRSVAHNLGGVSAETDFRNGSDLCPRPSRDYPRFVTGRSYDNTQQNKTKQNSVLGY